MRNKLLTLCLTVASVCAVGMIPGYAQSDEFHQSIGINAKVSNNGYGGDLYYRPFKKFAFKAGYETINLPIKVDEIQQDDITLNADVHYKSGATSLTAIYQPFGGFYLTAGAALLNLKPSVYAVSSGTYDMGDISVPADKVGDIEITIKPQNKIAPYAGFGIGNAFPRDWPVSFSFEVGAFFMGSPQLDIKATGMLAPNEDPEHIASLQNEVKDFKFYPVVKFNLGFRLYTFGKNK